MRDCPNCGAALRDDGVNDAFCTFCGTQVEMPRARRAASRRELEAERDRILARERDLDARIKQGSARGIEDFVVPPVGCCGIYFGLFVVGMLLLSALGLKDSKPYSTAVAAIAILAALLGVVLIIWRRETRRREHVVELERERNTDRDLREERLREIEAALKMLE